MELILQRVYFPNGTNGMLYHNGKLLCYTIELPWLNNEHQHSCIPEGTYRLAMRYSLKFKLHIEVKRVSNRDLVLIHPANDAIIELKGCIAPVSMLTGEGKGAMSRKAFEQVKQLVAKLLEHGPVFLTIKSTQHDDSTKTVSANTTIL